MTHFFKSDKVGGRKVLDMAGKLQTFEEWQVYDKTRMTEAVREISSSPNLRYFMRSFLASTGATGTPDGPTPIDMARSVGRHSVGTHLIGVLTQYQPNLYGVLLKEDADELEIRSNMKESPDDDYNAEDYE